MERKITFQSLFFGVQIGCTPQILSLQCSCESSKFFDNLVLLKRKAEEIKTASQS
jgi:hypothetical protein